MQVIVALGANVPGPWGGAKATLRRALRQLCHQGVAVIRVSPLYATKPVSAIAQPMFLNAVAVCETSISAPALLRLFKTLEYAAGRRAGARWGPRPLDLDILDFGRQRRGGRLKGQRRSGLVLPHPEMHRRAFVLVPLVDVAPTYRHPGFNAQARNLLARLPRSEVSDCRALVSLRSSWHR